MKWIHIVCVALFFPAIVFAEKIMLEWDQPEGEFDGVRIYSTIREWNFDTEQVEHEYDFRIPLKTDEYPTGDIPSNVTSIVVDLPGVADDRTKYMFVARAFLEDEESENSNEVSYVVNNIVPPVPTALAGSYTKDTGIINVQWEQAAEAHNWAYVHHWIIYYRLSGETEWTAIGRVNKDAELSLTVPFDKVEPGEQKEVEFTIVAYRRSGVYSADSAPLSITVDRRQVPPIQNLRINIEIPVI
ncbi:MAG: hypothetical protein KJN62_06555 [Deltaproteobacteria bacterium]|nr:hypothetical protein [Deltaproteobacteria bacterium]